MATWNNVAFEELLHRHLAWLRRKPVVTDQVEFADAAAMDGPLKVTRVLNENFSFSTEVDRVRDGGQS